MSSSQRSDGTSIGVSALFNDQSRDQDNKLPAWRQYTLDQLARRDRLQREIWEDVIQTCKSVVITLEKLSDGLADNDLYSENCRLKAEVNKCREAKPLEELLSTLTDDLQPPTHPVAKTASWTRVGDALGLDAPRGKLLAQCRPLTYKQFSRHRRSRAIGLATSC